MKKVLLAILALKNHSKKFNLTAKLPISKITIPHEMLSHPPRSDNLAAKYTYYIRTGQFLSPITIDKKNCLTDGYITYLIAKMMGHKTVEVKFV